MDIHNHISADVHRINRGILISKSTHTACFSLLRLPIAADKDLL